MKRKTVIINILLLFAFLVLIITDQILYTYYSSKAKETFYFKPSYLHIIGNMIIYASFSFGLCIKSKYENFKDFSMKSKFDLKWLIVRVIPLIILLYVFSPIGYFSLVPLIPLKGQIFLSYSAIINRKLAQGLLSVAIGYTLANSFKKVNP